MLASVGGRDDLLLPLGVLLVAEAKFSVYFDFGAQLTQEFRGTTRP
jgi:hypothetical protein